MEVLDFSDFLAATMEPDILQDPNNIEELSEGHNKEKTKISDEVFKEVAEGLHELSEGHGREGISYCKKRLR